MFRGGQGRRSRTLRLIKDHDVIVRRTGCANAFISEVVDVLDEGLHALTDSAFPFRVPDPRQFVASERFLKDGYERTVS
jgi:hypothetical protein